MIHCSFSCLHIRPQLLTFDSQPLTSALSVRQVPACLPQGSGFFQDALTRGGFSIVFSGFSTLQCPTLHTHFFSFNAHGFYHNSCPRSLPRFSAGTMRFAREFQTCFIQRHQNIFKKEMKPYFRLPLPSLFDL